MRQSTNSKLSRKSRLLLWPFITKPRINHLLDNRVMITMVIRILSVSIWILDLTTVEHADFVVTKLRKTFLEDLDELLSTFCKSRSVCLRVKRFPSILRILLPSIHHKLGPMFYGFSSTFAAFPMIQVLDSDRCESCTNVS